MSDDESDYSDEISDSSDESPPPKKEQLDDSSGGDFSSSGGSLGSDGSSGSYEDETRSKGDISDSGGELSDSDDDDDPSRKLGGGTSSGGMISDSDDDEGPEQENTPSKSSKISGKEKDSSPSKSEASDIDNSVPMMDKDSSQGKMSGSEEEEKSGADSKKDKSTQEDKDNTHSKKSSIRSDDETAASRFSKVSDSDESEGKEKPKDAALTKEDVEERSPKKEKQSATAGKDELSTSESSSKKKGETSSPSKSREASSNHSSTKKKKESSSHSKSQSSKQSEDEESADKQQKDKDAKSASSKVSEEANSSKKKPKDKDSEKSESKKRKEKEKEEEDESSEYETESEQESAPKKKTKTKARDSKAVRKKSSGKKKDGASSEEESSEYGTDSEEEEENTASKKKKKANATQKNSSKKKVEETSEEESSEEEESPEYEIDSEEEDTAPKKKAKGKAKESKKAKDNKKSGKAKKQEESSEEESSDYETDSEEETKKSKDKAKGSKADKKKSAKTTPKPAKLKSNNSKDGDDESLSEEDVSASEDEEGDTSGKHKAIHLLGQFSEYYDLQDVIENGAVATIHAAKHKESGTVRAAKALKKPKEGEANKELVLKAVLNEFEMMKELDHPNIIKVHELVESDDEFHLVTDICKGVTVKEELMNSGLYSEVKAAVLIKQLLSCVSYFHGKNIAHRDIKPSAVLLEEKNRDQIRIIDFGMAAFCRKKDRLSEPVGTPAYMAPEILGMSYGKQSDIWSCGVLLFLMLSGQQAFKGSTTEDTFTNIVTGSFSFGDTAWKTISDDAKDFIKKLLTWDESSRPTAALALKHAWIVNNTIESTQLGAEGKKKRQEQYDAHSKLKKAACNFIASQVLTKSEKTRTDEVFESLESDGQVTRAKVKIGFQSLLGKHIGEDRLEQIFQLVDPGGTQSVDYTGFVFGTLLAKDLLNKENLSEVFEVFDMENTGRITVQELKDLLKLDLSLDKKAVKAIVAQVDKGGETKVLFDDFLLLAGVPDPEGNPTSIHSAAQVQQESKSTGGKSIVSNSKKAKQRRLDSFLQDNADTAADDKSLKSTGSISIKLSATQFVSHRLGQLTEHYEIVDFIAKGSYGVVCSAIHKETGTVRAIKELKKSKKNKAKNELLLKEFHILKTLDHPNILQMHELFEDKRHYYIVTGVSEGGDLHREIKHRGSFEEHEAAVLMKQILICVNYCHKNNTVHRDLKPGNILLEGHKKVDHIKIIDFGEAVISEPSAKLTEVAGTMAYMAPEVLGMAYGHKCDIWSCGVIAYLVLTGKQPLRGASDEETFSNIVKGNISYADPIWEGLSNDAQDFVKLLLSWEESVRPTAEESLVHPWIAKNSQRKTTTEQRRTTMRALSNIESFSAQSKLRVATCAFIASQLMVREEKEKIDDVFRAIDLNHDGSLNPEEVKRGYEKYFDRALSDKEVDAIFKQVDINGTGQLDYSEFLFGALDKQNLLSQANLKKAFSIFDTHGRGVITIEELKLLLKDSLSQNERKDDKALTKMIAQVDHDNDGKISYEDFVKMALGNGQGDAKGQKGILKDDNRRDNLKCDGSVRSVTFSELDELTEEDSLRVSSHRESRHLQDAIARASQKENKSRSNRDPPIYRPEIADPPSVEERLAAIKKKMGPADPEASRSTPSRRTAPKQQVVSPLTPPDIDPPTGRHLQNRPLAPSSRAVAGARNRSRQSPKDAKIDAACAGFDRVQEKIARLRTLLTAQDSTPVRPNIPAQRRRNRDRKRSSNLETLDSAFAKLSQIQSKMRALQALVKSNNI